jgi:hypothetical protein
MRPLILKSAIVIAVSLLSAASSAAQLPTRASLSEAVEKSFGSVVEAVTYSKPFYLTGDINGDRVQDLVIVVRVKGSRSSLSKDVRVVNPFEPKAGIPFPTDPAQENKLAIAIIHSWKNSQPAGKFLLIGDSPILILESSRPTSGPEAGDMKLMARNARRRNFPRAAKGDVILLITEVGGDSQLYWNGRIYLWEDSAED